MRITAEVAYCKAIVNVFYKPCHTEVGDGCVTTIVDIDVFRTDVPMENIVLVCCGKTTCHIKYDVYFVKLLESLDTELCL